MNNKGEYSASMVSQSNDQYSNLSTYNKGGNSGMSIPVSNTVKQNEGYYITPQFASTGGYDSLTRGQGTGNYFTITGAYPAAANGYNTTYVQSMCQ